MVSLYRCACTHAAVFVRRAVVPHPLVHWCTQSFPDATVAKNSAALLALHYLEPTRQYDRMFPEPYKTLWQTLTSKGARMAANPNATAVGASASATPRGRKGKKGKKKEQESHVCPKCGKAFSKAHGLATHDKREHPPPKRKPGDPDPEASDDDDDDGGAGDMWGPPAASVAGTAATATPSARSVASAPTSTSTSTARVASAASSASSATGSTLPRDSSSGGGGLSVSAARTPLTLTSQSYFASQHDRRKAKLERDKARSVKRAGRKGREMANRDPTIMMGDRHRTCVERLLEESGFGADFMASQCVFGARVNGRQPRVVSCLTVGSFSGRACCARVVSCLTVGSFSGRACCALLCAGLGCADLGCAVLCCAALS